LRPPQLCAPLLETEFNQLKPSKSGTGQRMYRKIDVENVLRIKKLLYDQGLRSPELGSNCVQKPSANSPPCPLPCPRQVGVS